MYLEYIGLYRKIVEKCKLANYSKAELTHNYEK